MAIKMTQRLLALTAILLLGLAGFYSLFPETTFDLLVKVERGISGLAPRRIQVQDLHFAYLEGGRGKALVLLHGFGANKDNWTRISKHLTPHFRVIAPDLTGFGESSPAPDGDYTIRAQARRLKALIQALGIKSFHLGGSSMGGNIAGAYAAAYPEGITSLLLIAPGGVASAKPSEMQHRLMDGQPIPLVAANTAEYERLLDFVFVKRPFIPRPMKQVLVQEAISQRPRNIQVFEQLRRPENIEPLENLLEGLAVPTLIVWGSRDRVLDVSGAGILQALMPNARAMVMDSVGHLPMIEKPEETAALYLNFLGLI